MIISTKTADFSVYINNEKANDVMSVELPEIEFTTDEISGGGIIGKIDMPSQCSPESMEATIKLRNTANSTTYNKLTNGGNIEIRWATDIVDSTTGLPDLIGNKVFMTGTPKTISDGTIESGAAQEAEITYELTTFKKMISGVTVLDIDKLNGVLKIGGKDYSSKLNSLL